MNRVKQATAAMVPGMEAPTRVLHAVGDDPDKPAPENPRSRIMRHQKEVRRGDVELSPIESIQHLVAWRESGGQIQVAGEPYTADEFGQVDCQTVCDHLSAGRLY